jgi:hypothetical protein
MTEQEYIHLLSILTLSEEPRRAEAQSYVNELDEEQREILSGIAAAHHVVLRALGGTSTLPMERFAPALAAEQDRVHRAVARLYEVCAKLEANDCPTMVIKSLDHWPDLGSDLDLLTTSRESKVISLMRSQFGATIQTPSWSDRLARKINFRLPNLPELVEIHFGQLGQAGEQIKLSERILQNRVQRNLGGLTFWVPAPEDRILLATLQRLYRHYYVRICDVANTRISLQSDDINFDELRRAAKRAGIWPGVATFLRLSSEYVNHYSGQHLKLPRRVWLASSFGIEKIYTNSGFLRLPLFPQGVALYARQLLRAVRRRDPVSSLRLGLVPTLALAANVKFKITGDENGIW